MFFPSATVAAIVLSFIGAPPIEARSAAPAPGAAVATPAPLKVAAGLWAPKKSKPRAPARDDDAREEELLKSPRAPSGGGDVAARPAKRRPIKMDDSEEEGDEEGAEEGDEEEEDRPKVVKRRKRVIEEEEADVEEPLDSQPSVIPRLIHVGIGAAMMRRSFSYDLATLQGDKGFRPGYQIALESYPFVTQPNGAYRTLGIGAFYEKQYGSGIQEMPMTGMFTGYPYNQGRWGFDVRWGIPVGQWVLIMPAVGYGRISTDLQRTEPTPPSGCNSTVTSPCFADTNTAYLSADVHLRFGVTPTFALSLAGGYMLGLGVGRGTDQIAAEAAATMRGFHVDAGAQLLISDYFAVQATIPFRRYSYAFDPPMGSTVVMYRGASDLYYGLMAGIAVFTK
jgi:hypothetical protein